VTVDERECLAERFEENRTRLRAVAYRMLGSLSEADDAVQESWLRLSRTDTSGVENLGGWLTTVVARVCLDMLRSRTSRHEEPLGGHVPDPIVGRGDGFDPRMSCSDSTAVPCLRADRRRSAAHRPWPSWGSASRGLAGWRSRRS
jgi:DNA-directed RNA polymerase specialized sigma24 family protein